MINLEEYIKLTKNIRQEHIDLSEPCLERGGISTNHRGVLAQFLDTTFPKGKILLCHACNNGKCSNPRHLYWGTYRENIVEDGTIFGTYKSFWQRCVDKHGYKKACEMKALGNHAKGGLANKGKPKSEEHKRKISETLKGKKNRLC